MRQLNISDGWSFDPRRDGAAPLPAEVTRVIIGSQCSSLLALCIMAEDVGLRGSDMTALVALTRLRCLKVRKFDQTRLALNEHPCQTAHGPSWGR